MNGDRFKVFDNFCSSVESEEEVENNIYNKNSIHNIINNRQEMSKVIK